MTTIEQKLIAKLKELVELMDGNLMALSIATNNKRDDLYDEIASLEQELAEQKPIEDRSHLIQINDGMDDDIEVNGLVDPSMIKCFTIGQKPENLRCRSCGEPISEYCSKCQRLWES